MRGFHSIKQQSVLVSLLTIRSLTTNTYQIPQQSKQTLQPAEETCQQPLASRLLNFAYFYTCVKFFCCRMLLSNMESKSLLKKVDTSLNESLGWSLVASNPLLQNCCQSYLELNLWISEETKTSWDSVYVRWKTLTFFTRLQYLDLQMALSTQAKYHYHLECTI